MSVGSLDTCWRHFHLIGSPHPLIVAWVGLWRIYSCNKKLGLDIRTRSVRLAVLHEAVQLVLVQLVILKLIVAVPGNQITLYYQVNPAPDHGGYLVLVHGLNSTSLKLWIPLDHTRGDTRTGREMQIEFIVSDNNSTTVKFNEYLQTDSWATYTLSGAYPSHSSLACIFLLSLTPAWAISHDPFVLHLESEASKLENILYLTNFSVICSYPHDNTIGAGNKICGSVVY